MHQVGMGMPRGQMSQAKQFAELLEEFERVGVDPNTISAGLAVSEEDARRALADAARRRRASGIFQTDPGAHSAGRGCRFQAWSPDVEV